MTTTGIAGTVAARLGWIVPGAAQDDGTRTTASVPPPAATAARQRPTGTASTPTPKGRP